jgi:hypothetical protein
VELLQKHQTCLPVRDWLTQAGDAKALTRQEAMEAALEREREREAELRLLQAGAIELSPTNAKDFDGSDLPNHPCFGRPRKRKLEEPHSDKPEPTVFDKLNADRGSADGIESGRGRKHAAKTHKTFGWLTMVVPYLLFWAFGSTKRCVDIAHACMNPMHICWTGCPCHRLVHIIVDIIFYFGVEESVNEEIRHRRRDKPGRDRDYDTAMYIVNRLVAIIGMLSSCATAMAMSALFTIYVAIAPEKGYKARVAELLKINRRSKRLAKAANRRKIILEDWDKDFFVISVGKKVRTKRGLEGQVISVDLNSANPKCLVEIFCSDGSTYIQEFAAKAKNRVRVVEPKFGPEKRRTRRDATSMSVKNAIHNFYLQHCIRSPCAKHRVRQRVSAFRFRYEQMIVMQHTFDELFSMYTKAKQGSPYLVSKSTFHLNRPWFLRCAKVDSCLCSCCSNYDGYMQGCINVGNALLATLQKNVDRAFVELTEQGKLSEQNAAAGNTPVSWPESYGPVNIHPDVLVRTLIDLASCKHKKDHMERLLCEESKRTEACINGSCSSCGLKKVWSEGLRRAVVDVDTNEVSADASLFWLRPVKWFRYEMIDKETGKAEDASTKEDCCAGEDDEWQKVKPKTSTRVLDRVEKRGTIIDFLDDWEPVFVRMCHHRRTLTQCKAADIEFERNAPPGWLKMDCDFAENFTILKKKALQSMYWMQLQCTIFVCVMSFVDKGKFFDMTIELAKDDEVTVQQDASCSFWAAIDTVEKDGADVWYILRDASGKLVQDEHGNSIKHERRCLHKREWTTNAIIGFTSDRKHDSLGVWSSEGCVRTSPTAFVLARR